MAVDHALLESVQASGAPVLRLYRWHPACLSFGRNQRAGGVYDADRARIAGIDVARRPTGGLAVLHDRELTYSVTAPLALFGGPRAAYLAINVALVHGLRGLGVPAGLAEEGPRRGPIADSGSPCFQAPAPGEVIAVGRKLVGSAQRVERRTLLQHGSILLDGSQDDVVRLRAGADGGLLVGEGPGSVTLRELLGAAPSHDELVVAIVAGFERICGTSLARRLLSRDEAARAAALEPRYRADAWTWRC
jgi:lipoate-protein ligase A